MKIAVIGHGNVGGALIKAWAKTGHDLTIGARRPADAKVKSLLNFSDNISVASVADSIKQAEVIVIAIPAQHAVDLAKQLGDLSGKVVIDTTNSVFRRPEPFRTAFEAFQKITGAEMAKCFNSTGLENMLEPEYSIGNHKVKADMFAAGSSARAKTIALQLAEDAGFVARDFGGDQEVELLEELCRLWIHLAMKQGLGRNIAFKLMMR